MAVQQPRSESGLAQLRTQLQPLLLEDIQETGKELGRGSYGAVYEVIVSGLMCAGKKPHDILLQDGEIDKFGQECLFHSKQRHPNIVQIMGIHYQPNAHLPMLVMEYLPMSLTQCLVQHQNLPLQIKYSVLLDVANGLNYLHSKRPPIVHRDLTSNNVLLTSSFMAKISDLGMSRMIDTFRRHNAYALTKAPGNTIVMPPEALKDNPVYDHKLDVFSYGCLILHVFTQQWPTPSDQFEPTGSHGMFINVSELKRRSKYIAMIPNDNHFLPFAKSCLEDRPEKRPSISNAIACAQQGISTLPPLKNTLELINANNTLLHQLGQVQEEKVSLEDEMNIALAAVKEERQQALNALAKAEEEIKEALDTAKKLELEKREAIEAAERAEISKKEALAAFNREKKEMLAALSEAEEERDKAVDMAAKMEDEKTKATEAAETAEKQARLQLQANEARIDHLKHDVAARDEEILKLKELTDPTQEMQELKGFVANELKVTSRRIERTFEDYLEKRDSKIQMADQLQQKEEAIRRLVTTLDAKNEEIFKLKELTNPTREMRRRGHCFRPGDITHEDVAKRFKELYTNRNLLKPLGITQTDDRAQYVTKLLQCAYDCCQTSVLKMAEEELAKLLEAPQHVYNDEERLCSSLVLPWKSRQEALSILLSLKAPLTLPPHLIDEVMEKQEEVADMKDFVSQVTTLAWDMVTRSPPITIGTPPVSHDMYEITDWDGLLKDGASLDDYTYKHRRPVLFFGSLGTVGEKGSALLIC